MNNIPEEGKDIIQFFKLSAVELASSSKHFYNVEDPNELEFDFNQTITNFWTANSSRSKYDHSPFFI